MWCMLHHLLGHSAHSAGHSPASQEPAAREILERRFALGEISREQFEEMVRVLSSAEGSSARAYQHSHS